MYIDPIHHEKKNGQENRQGLLESELESNASYWFGGLPEKSSVVNQQQTKVLTVR